MKLKMVGGFEASVCALAGCAGSCLFLFAFPKGSISTLMHEVLGLPGPGAGIALILGPVLVLVALIPILVGHGNGGGLIGSLTFGLTCGLFVSLLGISTNPKGAFGSLLFIAIVALFGLVAEASMILGRALRSPWRCMLSGALSNATLLILYWTAIFPRTATRVLWQDVPLLMGLCLVCGVSFGYLAYAISRSLSRSLTGEEKE